MTDEEAPGHEAATGISCRLAEAIHHLGPARRADLRRDLDRQGWTGGLKGGIALLAGLPTPSVLSDMLAGRSRGRRHLSALARILGVAETWLAEGRTPEPDWALEPETAFRRWALTLAARLGAWSRAAGAQPGSWMPGPMLSPASRTALAERLALEADDPVLELLAAQRWGEIRFALLEAIAAELGLPAAEDPDHLRRGHAIIAAAVDDDHAVTAAVAKRLRRYRLPPALFATTRLALTAMRAHQRHLGQDTGAIEDSLELLWRDQLASDGERPPALPPEGFVADTGRGGWTPSAVIRARYGVVD